MAVWVNSDVLDNGLQHIKDNCNKIAVISAYTPGDNYATVNGNILGEAAMATGDFTLGNGASSARTLTTASGKSDASANGTGPASHFAFLDTVTSAVLWVTDETSGQTITAGNPVNFPQLVYTSQQPTAA